MRLTEEDISGLDVGDIFYECDYGHNLEARVISKPLRDESSDLWSWAQRTQKMERLSNTLGLRLFLTMGHVCTMLQSTYIL